MYNSTEMFELPDVWRKYMDTQGWKKIEAIGFGTGAFIAWPTKPTLRVRLEVIWFRQGKLTSFTDSVPVGI
jgi:hypothetical protein